MRYKTFFAAVMFAVSLSGYSQGKNDTAAIVKEFRKLMDFAREPYVFYTTKTIIASTPVIDTQDTVSMQGVFYKNGTDLYYSNGPDEVYLQDSLMIQVNNDRKSVWISRVDMDSKQKMNALQVGNKELQEMMQRSYTMQKTIMDNHNVRLHFASKQMQGRSTYVTSSMDVQYDDKTNLPQQLSIEMRLQEPADDVMIAAIKDQGIDESKLIQTINGERCLVRTQMMTTAFGQISHEKQLAMQMPLLGTVVEYDPTKSKFTGKGLYAAYEITKTF